MDSNTEAERLAFLKSRDEVFASIEAIDPALYERTRNYLDGAVTQLGPYLTHGIVDTVDVAERLLAQYPRKKCYKLLFELAWREYFHRVWQDEGSKIFDDLLHPQQIVEKTGLPESIASATTGIDVIDRGLKELFETGRMHNHLRMWVAGLTCNTGHTAWKEPARWMHYHLLDGDLASNTLSWQWIAGTFSHKRYIANQQNINKYSRSEQNGTWLDLGYEELDTLPTPSVLSEVAQDSSLEQQIRGHAVPLEVPHNTVALHSLWNLDANWTLDDAHPVLFIEREHSETWPMSPNRWAFIEYWANQLELDIWVDDVAALVKLENAGTSFFRKEYPACANWPGTVTGRRFLYDYPAKPFNSFSKFWKQVKDQNLL